MTTQQQAKTGPVRPKASHNGSAMTPEQKFTVDTLRAIGFHIVLQAKDIVRMTKGADKRLVRTDGSQRRGNQAAERLERMALIAEAGEKRT